MSREYRYRREVGGRIKTVGTTYYPKDNMCIRMFKILSPDGSGREILSEYKKCNYKYSLLATELGVSVYLAKKLVTKATELEDSENQKASKKDEEFEALIKELLG